MGAWLGSELKLLRQAKGLSIRDLAQNAGLPHTSYAAYEQGVAAPPAARRSAVASALGIPRRVLDEIIEQDEYEIFLRARKLSAAGRTAIHDFIKVVRDQELGRAAKAARGRR